MNWAGRLGLRAIGAGTVAPPSLAVATVLGWAGMRGVVTLMAALSLPASLPGRNVILVSAFSVILVTVFVQGSTLGPLISALGLNGAHEAAERRITEARARARIADAQFGEIATASRQAGGGELHPRLLEQFGRQAELAAASADDLDAHADERTRHHSAVIGAIGAGRAEALKLHGEGEIHDETLRSIEWELDLQQLASESRLEPTPAEAG